MKTLRTYLAKEDTCTADKLIRLYRDVLDDLSRHSKVHLMTRGNLIGMFTKSEMTDVLKENAKTLDDVLNLFDSNIDKLLNDFVLIGYKSDKRKHKIGELFSSVNEKYKKFLCLITILEMTYTYQRVDMLNLIDLNRIHHIMSDNIDIIESCIKEDKYEFKNKAATKYINSIFFIINVAPALSCLNRIKFDNGFLDKLVNHYIDLYRRRPDTTTLYGITHILIGASDFYRQQIDVKYHSLLNSLYDTITDKHAFDMLTLDLQMEILLCCKLFGMHFDIDMSKHIDCSDLEKNEHTNMLYILLKKYDIR